MEKGYLQAGQIMLWAKKKHKISLLPRDGEVLIAKNYLTGVALEAYICKQCKKVVFDYASTEVI
jgi:hypothetical protein